MGIGPCRPPFFAPSNDDQMHEFRSTTRFLVAQRLRARTARMRAWLVTGMWHCLNRPLVSARSSPATSFPTYPKQNKRLGDIECTECTRVALKRTPSI